MACSDWGRCVTISVPMRLLATLMESIPDACRLKVLRMRLAAEHLAHFSSRIKSAWNESERGLASAVATAKSAVWLIHRTNFGRRCRRRAVSL